MAKTIRDLAKELNCSYEAVRKQTKRYAKELEEHIYTQHKTQFLDDYACEFIKSKRMDSPSVISRIEYDEAVEILKQKYTELLEKHNELQEQNRQLVLETAKIARLEADNEAQRVKIAEAEAEAQNAQKELTKAHDSFEKELKKRNKEAWHHYRIALEIYNALPWWKKRRRAAPEPPSEEER